MEFVLGLIGAVLRWLAFCAIFFWPGWLVLNVLTLGRYPRVRRPDRNIGDPLEVELVSVVGLLSVVAVIVLLARLFSAS